MKYKVISPTLEDAKELQRNKQDFYSQIKSSSVCCVCGSKEDLTFHHRDRSSKVNSLSNMVGSRVYYNMEIFKQEVEKCDIVCRACHDKIELGIDRNDPN